MTAPREGRRPIQAILAAAATLLLLAPPPVAGAQDAPPPPPATGEVTLSGSGPGSALLVVRFRDPATAPAELRERAREQGGDDAVRTRDDGELELRFALPGMDEVIPILRRAKEGLDALPVTIRIPSEYRSGDVWTFQARLSQAGIRQVRIVTDPSRRTRYP